MELENTSADHTPSLWLDEISAEGLMYDPDFRELGLPSQGLPRIEDAAPGTVESDSVVIDTEVFEEIGVMDFTDIMMTFSVTDYGSYDLENNLAGEGTVHIYPHGQENAAVYVRESLAEDVVLADTADVTLTAVGYETDEEKGDFTATLYMQNKSDRALAFKLDENSLNGYMITSFPYGYGSYVYIPAGASSYLPVEFDGEDLKENGITDVETLEFRFHLCTTDDAGNAAETLLEETYSLTP